MKKIYWAIGAITLVLAVYFMLPSAKVAERPGMEAVPVKRYVAAEGKVEAMPGLDVEVGSEVTERIESFLVKEGDTVKKGDIVARLENKDIRAKLRQAEEESKVARSRLKEVASGSRKEEIKKAEANLEAAIADLEFEQKNLERYQELFKEALASRSLLDEKERAFKVAKAGVKEAEEEKTLLEKGPKAETLKLYEDEVARAEAAVEYCKRLLEKSVIKAPISGKLIHRHLDEGEIVVPETPIASIADVENIRINAEVDETDAGKISFKDPVEVTSDAYPGKVFKGEIQEIAEYVGSRKIKPNNTAKNLDMKVLQVKIELKEKTPFKIGMTVDVRISPKEKGL